ncbi:hypothetical protein JCM9140_2332 [Halalkalibacter wakoensis JCM 9140]|uniref:Lipoprotein n=1 Tax=Halalkalibacter wakoensis JCM 9140 TaxID=1236970 RepID=W4Q3H8_9BACI|nr:hypothetical protein [Halalkalibacter wakoensis]GAE26283.1 hypothetical protein JCM9140_2332 [Halalkalibacter wakoensis JCM 9140]
MKKFKKLHTALLVGASLVLVSACSNGEEAEEQEVAEVVEVELDEAEEVEGTEEESEEAVELELESSSAPDETDAEMIEQMEAEENVDEAMVYVTDDGYVLVSMFVNEGVDVDAAEVLAQQYGEELLAKYADHVVDIEVLQGNDFLTHLVVE